MLAMIGWLKSRGHCSYTTIATWMGDILQVPVCRGYWRNLCNGVISDSLADAYEELKAAIPAEEDARQRRIEPEKQRQEALDLVRHRDNVQRVSHRRFPQPRGA